MDTAWSERSQLPPIRYRIGDFESFYAQLLSSLGHASVAGVVRDEPLARLEVDDPSDWMVALCGAWAELAEIISFYQERIINDAFLATSSSADALTRLAHSLGHELPPNTSASSVVSYTLRDRAAGVEALLRARAAGSGTLRATASGTTSPLQPAAPPPLRRASGRAPSGSGQPAQTGSMPPGGRATPQARPSAPIATASRIPSAAQIRALAHQDDLPARYVTLEALDAQVGASELTALASEVAVAASLRASTTQLECAGVKTGLSPGAPVLLVGTDPVSGATVRFVRLLTMLTPNAARGTTRIGWSEPLDAGGDPERTVALDPVVYGFARTQALFGAEAPPWSSLRATQQLAAAVPGGGRVLMRGGVVTSNDLASGFVPGPPGLPPGATPVAVLAAGDLVLVGTASDGLYRSERSGAFQAVSLGGTRRGVLFLGGSLARLFATTGTGGVYSSVDGGRTWSAVTGGPPTVIPVAASTPGASRGNLLARAARRIVALAVGLWRTRSAVGDVVEGIEDLAHVAEAAPSPHGALDRPPGVSGEAPAKAPTSAQAAAAPGAGAPVRASSNAAQQPRSPSSASGAMAKPPVATRTQVVQHQLPAAPVRAVLEVPGGLCAATDQGAFFYDGTNWAPDGLGRPVFCLVATTDGLLAGTDAGVYRRGRGPGSWSLLGGRLSGALRALVLLDGQLYAGGDAGVTRLEASRWVAAGGKGATALPGVPVRALAAAGHTLLAGTDGSGLFCSEDGGESWARRDVELLFSLEVPAHPTGAHAAMAVDDTVVAAFAGQGLPLDSSATMAPAGNGWEVADGDRRFRLEPAGAKGHAYLLEALGSIGGIAAQGTGIFVASDQAGVLPTEWPGFALAGDTLELDTVVPQIVPGVPALAVQTRVGTLQAELLALRSVEQVAVNAFGRQARITRLRLERGLDPRTYGRRTTTIWFAPTLVGLQPTPSGAVARVSGRHIEVLGLRAPVAQGRRAVVTGRPIGLVVCPSGGAYRLEAGKVAAIGPLQGDGRALCIDRVGRVVLATSEGPFALSSHPGDAVELGSGWPGGPAHALALASFGAVLAASDAGLVALTRAMFAPQRLTSPAPSARHVLGPVSGAQAPLGPPERAWVPAGLSGTPIAAVVTEGHRAVALSIEGAIFSGPATGDPAATWSRHATTGAAVHALALARGLCWVGTEDGVFVEATSGQWRAGPPGLRAVARQLVAADDGTLFAATDEGLAALHPRADHWVHDLGVGVRVFTVAVAANGQLAAATAAGVVIGTREGSWRLVAGAPSAPSALAFAPDGALWAATSTALPVEVAPDAPMPELNVELVATGVALRGEDLTTLDQGGLPSDLAASLSDRGIALRAGQVDVQVRERGSCWLVQSGGERYVLARRAGGAGPRLTIQRIRFVACAAGPGQQANGLEHWPVVAAGVAGTLRAPSSQIVAVPAPSDAANLAEVVQLGAPARPGSGRTKASALLELSAPLARVYDASSVQVSLNVVPVAQGQPVSRPVGSGDPRVPNQTVRVPGPVAAIAPPSRCGRPSSTLVIEVDGEPWHEVPTLLSAASDAQVFRVQANADGSVLVHFGDGVHGARLPAGRDNVVAHYLEGGGPAGDAEAGQLIQPLTRPQLVIGVHNPIPAQRPPAPDARTAALVKLRTLGRIVSLADHAAAAEAQPGVAAASAQLITGRAGPCLVVSLAASPDAPDDLESRVSEVLETERAPGPSLVVCRARLVGVSLQLEVTAEQNVSDAVRELLEGHSAKRPALPLLAGQVLSAAMSLPGVVAAQILRWGRDGTPLCTASALAAAPASWRFRDDRVVAAELLVIGTAPGRLAITIRPPAGAGT